MEVFMDTNKNMMYKIYQAILSYSIDEYVYKFPLDPKNPTVWDSLNINEEIFFDSLYVKRKIPEERIRNFLSVSYRPIVLYGYPGTGKTSIIHKIMYDFQKVNKGKSITLFLDFKHDDSINREEDDAVKLYEYIRTTITFKMKKKLFDEINEKLSKLILFLITTNLVNIENVKLLDCRMRLKNAYFNDEPNREFNNEEFTEWVTKSYYNKTDFVYREIETLEIEINNIITLKEYLFYILYSLGNTVFIIFDNIDNIFSYEKREILYQIFRSFAGSISNLAHCIICAREKTLVKDKFLKNDVLDRGSREQEYILIDYDEFLNKEKMDQYINFLKIQKFPITEKVVLEVKQFFQEDAKKKFSDELFFKRMEYFNNILKTKNDVNKYFDLDFSEKVEYLYTELVEKSYIFPNLLDLCNNDRHYFLRHLSSFLFYLLDNIDFKYFKSISNKYDEAFYLENYFYGWIIYNDLFNFTQYDIVNDFKLWKTKDPLQRISKNGCYFRHLLLVLIFNLTYGIRGLLNGERTIKIGEVINKLAELGYSRETIIKEIFNFYFDRNREYYGYIELSKAESIHTEQDITSDLSIWLTPRAVCMIKFINNKYIYGITLCSTNQLTCCKKTILNLDMKRPITPEVIDLSIEYLYELAKMHLTGLYEIKNVLFQKYNEAWLNHYKKYYCLQKRRNENTFYTKELQFFILMESNIKFLFALKKLPDYTFINQKRIKKFRDLLSEYENTVNQISEFNTEIEMLGFFKSKCNFINNND
jgi:Cdc6-like AAA superfamily ATPase